MDRRRKRDLVEVDHDPRAESGLGVLGKAVDGLGEARPSDGRPVQVAAEGPYHVVGLLLARGDPIEVLAHCVDLTMRESLLRHLELERHAKECLGEVIVQVAGDLHTLVVPLLSHAVRKGTEDPLAIL